MRLSDILLAGKAHAPITDPRGDHGEPEFVRARPGHYAVGTAKQHSKAYAGGRTGIDHFYSAANVYTRQASKAALHFHKADGTLVKLLKDPDDPADVEEVDAALYELLTQPNPWMAWPEMFALMVIDLLSVGNFVAVKQGADADGNKPAALYRLPVEDVEIESTKSRHINKYVYTGGPKTVKYDPQQVFHVRLPNPHSPYSMWGAGVIQAAPQPFDIELGLVEAQRNFFANGTVLGGVIESDRVIPESTRKRAVREIENLHRGSRNWWKLAFLERGMRYRAIQANAMEAGYETLSRLSAERIFAMLHVSRLLVGVGLDEAPKGAIDDARRAFAEDVMRPFLDALAPVFTTQLTAAWGLRTEFDYRYVPPVDQRVQNAEKLATLPGMRVKEVREAAGYPPLGPDYIDEATGDLIDELVLNVPDASTESTQGEPDAVTGSDGGRPADPENRAPFATVPTSRTSALVNDRPASAADTARRARASAGARGRRRGVKASDSVSVEELASGEIFGRLG